MDMKIIVFSFFLMAFLAPVFAEGNTGVVSHLNANSFENQSAAVHNSTSPNSQSIHWDFTAGGEKCSITFTSTSGEGEFSDTTTITAECDGKKATLTDAEFEALLPKLKKTKETDDVLSLWHLSKNLKENKNPKSLQPKNPRKQGSHFLQRGQRFSTTAGTSPRH